MLSRWFRKYLPRLLPPVLTRLDRLGITPNGLSVASLALAVLAGVLTGFGQLLTAALALVFSGICDSLDGELARQHGRGTRLGPFIDSIADHYGDFAIYLGFLSQLIVQNNRAGIVLCFFTLFGSLAGSHIRSRAGMEGVDTKRIGFFTRMERTLVLLAGLLAGWLTPAMAVLAVATNLSALQRLWHVLSTGAGSRIDPEIERIP